MTSVNPAYQEVLDDLKAMLAEGKVDEPQSADDAKERRFLERHSHADDLIFEYNKLSSDEDTHQYHRFLNKEQMKSLLAGMMCSVMHWCHRERHDFSGALADAMRMFAHEKLTPEEMANERMRL